MICKICKNEIENVQKLSKHLIKHNKISVLQYFIDYENFIIPKCKHCNDNAKLLKGIVFRKTCGKDSCKKLEFSDKKPSESMKMKISESMKLSHSTGNHPGWSFINKDVNKRSYPEKWFVKNFLEKYNFYSKYTIKEKMPFHKYFLDFAILDMKIDIEIDGQQHFRNEESINHDKERDEFLLNNDWRVYRIAWLELKNNPDVVINNFLYWIELSSRYRKYDVEKILDYLKKKKVYGNMEMYNKIRKNKSLEKNNLLVEKIKNSQIDFSKFGWVKKVSNLIEMKEQKINKWMIKFMNDFYNDKCFKRLKRPCSSTD